MRDHLSVAELGSRRAALEQRLTQLRTTLLSHLDAAEDDRARLLADRVRDTEDESLADLLVDLDLADIDRDLAEVRAVEGALARLRAGRYGECLSCGAAIPVERLEAQPEAARCVRCQEVHDRTHAGPGTPSL
ncbi:MAG: TraR/DksA family transcriptional regulator [Proteobacteria bacterium]|nr:TraR/DksA family transcriptional regulator [Pseudomonadota bacterium]